MEPEPGSPLPVRILRRAWPWLRRGAYPLFAGTIVLIAASTFYASLKLQILYSAVRGDPYLHKSDWSAPLDDVFIHFDFARQTARGRPFEWSPGNGYSSGGTSLLYPFVLAPGFWLGFRGGNIMGFAALVACISIFGLLLGTRRVFRAMPGWTAFLAPPVLLSIGALNWSLFSGMEVAFFLTLWALALVFWDDLVNGVPGSVLETPFKRGAMALGVANALVVATRPEALTTALVFAVTAAWAVRGRRGTRAAGITFALSIALSVLVLAMHAVANRVLTGDFSAAGALVKLEINDPRMTAREAWDAWVFHVRYQVGRVTGYHLGTGLWLGSLLWVLAALPFAFESTRLVGLLLWAQAISWVLVVALNGQVRWQNERYSMPAVTWMLLSAAVGIGAVFTQDLGASFRAFLRGRYSLPPISASGSGVPRSVPPESVQPALVRGRRLIASGLVVVTVVALAIPQVQQMRDQIWFFGRASRNIRDQHVKVGRIIKEELSAAHRVLVGDAGAIPFESDMPALDIIGLGGYRDLPFARASRWGVGSAIELIERIPPESRPDLMAIYPSWWGDFPLWFGVPLDGVSVRGNVICGALTKMLYAARWNALDIEQRPITTLLQGERLVDSIDFADVISEKEHAYRIEGALGFVAMKLLAASGPGKGREVWDAGRVTFPGVKIRFTLKGFEAGRGARLLVRTAPSRGAHLLIAAEGHPPVRAELRPTDTWLESVIELPKELVSPELRLTLTVEDGEVVVYHLWGIASR